MKNQPFKIGIFDSGVGGLTVAQSIAKYIKNVPMVYFGDSARVPYGNKSKENILAYSEESVNFLIGQGANIIVIACNTSSAIALPMLKKKFSIPIIGVVEPGAAEALETAKRLADSQNRKTITITIAGTYRTINSHIYRKKITAINKAIRIHEIACPLLVPIIEEGLKNPTIIHQVIREYLAKTARTSQILLLGCTHYPLIKKTFEKLYPHLIVIDSAETTARYLQKTMEKHNHLPTPQSSSIVIPIKIFTNDRNEVFKTISEKLFPKIKVNYL